MTTAAITRSRRWPVWLAAGALILWGIVHVLGGISLLAGGVANGLESLGPSAKDSVPAEPGDTTAGLLRFHALNVLLGGLAVLGLTAAWLRQGRSWQLAVAFGVAVALDIGLVAFLVAPGVLPASQGLIGPLLVALAAVGALAASRRISPTPYPQLEVQQ